MHTRGWHDKTCPHIGKCNLGAFPGEVPQVDMCLCVNKLGTSYIRWTRQCILLWLELCMGLKICADQVRALCRCFRSHA